MNVLITVVILLLILIIAGLALVSYLVKRKFEQMYQGFVNFITPRDEKTPSEFTNVMDAVTDRASKIVVSHFKGQMLGVLSGQSRQEKAILGDIAQDELEAKNPGMMGLLSQFPSLKKRIGKNPELINTLVGMLGNLRGGTGTNGDSKNESNGGFAEISNKMNRFGG